MEYRELVGELVFLSGAHRWHINKAANSIGLYFGQPQMLRVILENESCTQRELAETLHISAASAATSLKRLEKSGFVVRTQDSADSRKNRLVVTDSGKDALRRFHEICKKTDTEMFKGFSDEECETLYNLIKRLQANIAADEITKEQICEIMKKSKIPEKNGGNKKND